MGDNKQPSGLDESRAPRPQAGDGAELAAAWLATASSVGDREVRAKVISRSVSSSPISEIAAALELICLRAEQADSHALDVLASWVPHVTDEANADYWTLVRQAAEEHHLLAVGRLLRRRKRSVMDSGKDPDERPLANLPEGRALTLGERKSLARGRDRFMIDRLLRDPHPQVIRNVLSNPRVIEDDIIRLAARRPTYPDVQGEIARSPRWGHRPRVRLALVQNPFTPTAISVPLVALLLRPDLESVVAATNLSVTVRAAAAERLQRRPPLRTEVDTEPEPT
jgi:hypothetical protein